MIASDHIDPFGELIAQGHVRPLDRRNTRLAVAARILRPTNLAALAELVTRSNNVNNPFSFLGGGTSIAQTPTAFIKRSRMAHTLAISLECLNRVIEYRPMDFAITLEAGMPVAQLREFLAMRGQTITLDTPEIGTSTIGGLLASARCGPRRRTLGRTRDALLGATLVLADGNLIDTGGRSLRQARAYDLARLFVGSHGSLGAYATVTLRTRPLPEARRCTITTLPEGTRDRAIASLDDLPIEPTAALLLDGFDRKLPGWSGPDGRLFLFFEGHEEAITRATRDLRTIFGTIGISETRIFDREADVLLDQVLDAPFSRVSRESTATIRLFGVTHDGLGLRSRVQRLTNEIGVATEIITDLQNDDIIARVRASSPRALAISARETFIRLAGEIERTELLEAPASFREKFEEAMPGNPEREERIRTLRSVFDPQGLCAVDRGTLV